MTAGNISHILQHTYSCQHDTTDGLRKQLQIMFFFFSMNVIPHDHDYE